MKRLCENERYNKCNELYQNNLEGGFKVPKKVEKTFLGILNFLELNIIFKKWMLKVMFV